MSANTDITFTPVVPKITLNIDNEIPLSAKDFLLTAMDFCWNNVQYTGYRISFCHFSVYNIPELTPYVAVDLWLKGFIHFQTFKQSNMPQYTDVACIQTFFVDRTDQKYKMQLITVSARDWDSDSYNFIKGNIVG